MQRQSNCQEDDTTFLIFPKRIELEESREKDKTNDYITLNFNTCFEYENQFGQPVKCMMISK